jgi:hypothetical protein
MIWQAGREVDGVLIIIALENKDKPATARVTLGLLLVLQLPGTCT